MIQPSRLLVLSARRKNHTAQNATTVPNVARKKVNLVKNHDAGKE